MKTALKVVGYGLLTLWGLAGVVFVAGLLHAGSPWWAPVVLLAAWFAPPLIVRWLCGIAARLLKRPWGWLSRACGGAEDAARVMVKTASVLTK